MVGLTFHPYFFTSCHVWILYNSQIVRLCHVADPKSHAQYDSGRSISFSAAAPPHIAQRNIKGNNNGSSHLSRLPSAGASLCSAQQWQCRRRGIYAQICDEWLNKGSGCWYTYLSAYYLQPPLILSTSPRHRICIIAILLGYIYTKGLAFHPTITSLETKSVSICVLQRGRRDWGSHRHDESPKNGFMTGLVWWADE